LKCTSRLTVTGKAGLIATYSFVPYLTEHMHQICFKLNSATGIQTGEIKHSVWNNADLWTSHQAVYIISITHQMVQCVSSGFRREVAENCGILGHYTAGRGNFLPTFRGNLTVPNSGFKGSFDPQGSRQWVVQKCQ